MAMKSMQHACFKCINVLYLVSCLYKRKRKWEPLCHVFNEQNNGIGLMSIAFGGNFTSSEYDRWWWTLGLGSHVKNMVSPCFTWFQRVYFLWIA